MEPRVLLPTLLAGAAVLLIVPSPGRALHRLRPLDPAGTRQRRRLTRLLGGRPDAAPLRRRVWWSGAAGTALALALGSESRGTGPWAWLAGPLVALGGVLLLGWLEPPATQLRRQRLVLEAPQALELIASCLAVGMSTRRACGAVTSAFDGPVAEDFGQVLRSVELGVPDAEAWRALAGHPQLGPAALDLARSTESGTELVSALRSHASTARDRRRAALQQAARAVGVRSVLPLTTCFLPAFLLLGIVPTVASAVLHAFG